MNAHDLAARSPATPLPDPPLDFPIITMQIFVKTLTGTFS